MAFCPQTEQQHEMIEGSSRDVTYSVNLGYKALFTLSTKTAHLDWQAGIQFQIITSYIHHLLQLVPSFNFIKPPNPPPTTPPSCREPTVSSLCRFTPSVAFSKMIFLPS